MNLIELDSRLRTLEFEKGKLDTQIGSAYDEFYANMTTLGVLNDILCRSQDFPLELRQCAAWGIHRILEGKILQPSVAEEVSKNLNEFLSSNETQGEVSSQKERVVEWFLRLLDDSLFPEFLGTLKRGLLVMSSLIEKKGVNDPLLEKDFSTLAYWVNKDFPKFMDFLRKYPLRLMPLNRNRKVLGEYAYDKFLPQLWYRFIPPHYSPKLNPGEYGPCIKRWPEIDERVEPNSMGIFYRLFEHPVLVLPVLFHEFLHFGGPDGILKEGISNEAEVLIWEIIYARHLIAKLSPINNSDLVTFEDELAKIIREQKLFGLAQQFSFDFDNPNDLQSINDEIEKLYGKPMDHIAANLAADSYIQRFNEVIAHLNHTDPEKSVWNPEIEWRNLSHEDPLTLRITAIFLKNHTQNHRVDADNLRLIMQRSPNPAFLSEWKDYLFRSNLSVFKEILEKIEFQTFQIIVPEKPTEIRSPDGFDLNNDENLTNFGKASRLPETPIKDLVIT